ncbi:HlyC/CorC family transporter [Corynebacterium aquatimens]|nr:hemolysin family protein [Corynebacterium aquatimens]
MGVDVWVWYGVVSFVTIILAGFLRTIETALTPVSRARVEAMVKDDVSGAKALLRVVDSRANHIGVLKMLETVLDTLSAVYAAMMMMDIIPSDAWAVTAAVLVVTFLRFGIVGVIARRQGKLNPYSISLRTAQVLTVTYVLLGPLSKLLIWIGDLVRPGVEPAENPYATDLEIREAVEMAEESGAVETAERRMIQSIFDLDQTYARQVMVPRPEMIWIESDKTAAQAANLMIRSGHSRVPVIGESVDEIVGIAYIKDLVERTYNNPEERSRPVAETVRQPMFMPDSKPLDAMLEEMQQTNTHIAILIDEYGGVAGMMTMEDILEEIVGEITDEYDEDEEAPIEEITRSALDDESPGPRRYRAHARLPLDDLVDFLHDEAHFDVEFDEEITDNVETVAGLISYTLGRVPLPGSFIEHEGMRFTAEGGRDRRGRVKVRSVVITIPERDLSKSPDADDNRNE